jgi:hypothetical protein
MCEAIIRHFVAHQEYTKGWVLSGEERAQRAAEVLAMEIEDEKTRRPRRRFGAEEKARVVGHFKESGLRRAEFCRREGVSVFKDRRSRNGARRRRGPRAQKI